jgi:hypothetical protein
MCEERSRQKKEGLVLREGPEKEEFLTARTGSEDTENP